MQPFSVGNGSTPYYRLLLLVLLLLNYSFFFKNNYGSRYWQRSPRFTICFFNIFLKSCHLVELKPSPLQATFLLLLLPVLASKPSERLGRSLKKSKKTLCESSSFIKTDQHSIVVCLFFVSVSCGVSFGASYLTLLCFGCFWGAFGAPCGFFGAVLGPM